MPGKSQPDNQVPAGPVLDFLHRQTRRRRASHPSELDRDRGFGAFFAFPESIRRGWTSHPRGSCQRPWGNGGMVVWWHGGTRVNGSWCDSAAVGNPNPRDPETAMA
ncbi:uncharacterized protein PV07_11362 [Cladophialophora immunda]|uniref:Uncharacterized protein n=1 Tax=Cladophialophora immunda TaxID=569365 RepID=A0A0D2CHV4_9EURO|nr:uncharacterized protein PV07_11362 [Cladophialophora immunda]KIW23139.1 hypothetical protein PV07_11362 [Cladophialophora immunda]